MKMMIVRAVLCEHNGRKTKSQLQILSLFTYNNRPPGEPNSPVDAGIQGQDKQGQYEEAQCHALLSANAFNAQDDNQEPCGKHAKKQLCQTDKVSVRGDEHKLVSTRPIRPNLH